MIFPQPCSSKDSLFSNFFGNFIPLCRLFFFSVIFPIVIKCTFLAVHIKGWFHENREIIIFEDRDVKFLMGEGIHPDYNVSENLEYFLKNMKKTEISRFQLASKHCFGEEGCPKLNVPPNKDLTYQIHLKNFERVNTA